MATKYYKVEVNYTYYTAIEDDEPQDPTEQAYNYVCEDYCEVFELSEEEYDKHIDERFNLYK
jgi:hypothetical protein